MVEPLTTALILDGTPLSLRDVERVARERVRLEVAPAVVVRLERARATVDRIAAGDDPIYGVTTALGANTGQPLAPAARAEYQARAVRARAVGVGPSLAEECVRAAMFVRVAGLAQGGSGVSVPVFRALIGLLNQDVCPVVPAWGSIGVADLAPLSHLALVLLGEGEAIVDGRRVPGSDALVRAGLAPVAFEVKDGVALISSNAATVGTACLVLVDLARHFDALDNIVALSFEGFRGNLSPFDPRVSVARPAPGQAAAASRLMHALHGSGLKSPGAARRVQDPLSFRCVAQVHGAALEQLARATAEVELELNSAADNPWVDAASGELISNGNFHIPGLALAHESLGLALAQVATLAVERSIKLLVPALSGLPLHLTPRGPEHSGFATAQKTLTALANDIRHLANPACLDFLPVSERIEDHATMAPASVNKLDAMRERLVLIAAIEAMIAAQAVDLRGAAVRDSLGAGARRAYSMVREHAAFLEDDRPLGPDFEAIAGALRPPAT